MSITQNNKIRVTDMDFASIKENFKNYLRETSEFADYDFEASAMSSLLDVLAYNTFYNSVQANFVANETFMDSAVKRDSVVSLAKALGYTPKSVKASKAKINLILTEAVGLPSQLTMKAGTPFETTVKDISYQFITLNDIVGVKNSFNEYNFGDFYIYQGQFQQNSFVAKGDEAETFSLFNSGIDTSTINVIVQKSASDLSYENWTLSDNIVNVDGEDLVFFIQEGINNTAQVYFGDGNIGKKLSAGNVVYITYITSDGEGANSAKMFKMTGNIEGNTISSIQTIEQSSGGADPENIDSIRFNAKSYFGVQNRAVTADDYKYLILQYFQNVKACITWGGENNSPPQFGKVFVCIQPKNTEYLTSNEIADVTSIIASRSVASVTPVFVAPEYTDLEISTTIYYDSLKNDKNSSDLSTLVMNNITTYADTVLGKFDTTFRYSVLSRVIDESDYSILNNVTTVKTYKNFIPVLSDVNIINVTFNNTIQPSSVLSTGYNIPEITQEVFFKDDGSGIIQLCVLNSSGAVRVVKPNIGSVNYANGAVLVENQIFTNYTGSDFKIYAQTSAPDVLSLNNNIVRLHPSNISISVYSDSIRTGKY